MTRSFNSRIHHVPHCSPNPPPPHRLVTSLIAVLLVNLSAPGQSITWTTNPAEGQVNNVKTGKIVGAGTASWAAGSTVELSALSMSGNKVIYYVMPAMTSIKGPGGQSIGCNFEFEITSPDGGKLPNGTYDVWVILSITAPGTSKSASSFKQATVTNGLAQENVAATITCQPVGGQGVGSASGSYTIRILATQQNGVWSNGWTIYDIKVYFVPNGGGSVKTVTATVTPDPTDASKGTWLVGNTALVAGTYKVLAIISVTGRGTFIDQLDGSGWMNVTVQ